MAKQQLVMYKGLPASGKSTAAKMVVDSSPHFARINKDDLRSMLHNGKWSKGNERQIIKARNSLVIDALQMGRSVIVDDTNFAPIHEHELHKLAVACGAEFRVEFFDTPLEECIKRDLQRPASVGERVIRQMYNQYLRPVPPVIEYDPTLPDAIICDIDGTLAHMDGRSPYEWLRVGEDKVDTAVRDILDRYYEDTNILLLSGRDSICRPQTIEWCEANRVQYVDLFMRAANDNRKDNIVKRELYEQHIKGKYNVLFVLDDRNQVVDEWRALGLKVLQVAEGDF